MAAGRSVAPCHGSIVGIEDISFLALQISEAFFLRNCWRICLFQAGDFAHKHVHPHVFLTQNVIRQIKKRRAQAQIAIRRCISDGRGDGGDFGKVPPAGQSSCFPSYSGVSNTAVGIPFFAPKITRCRGPSKARNFSVCLTYLKGTWHSPYVLVYVDSLHNPPFGAFYF